MSTQSSILVDSQSNNLRINELKAFDESKSGVKGLVDAGTKVVPSIFVRSPEDISKDYGTCTENISVPIIDLANIRGSNAQIEEIVKEISWASENWGFFQVINHGVPLELLQKTIKGARMFHEQDVEVKKKYYDRDSPSKNLTFVSNHDLYTSSCADWRDSFNINTVYTSDGKIEPHELPPICKDITLEYVDQMLKFGNNILMLLSMGLGLRADFLSEMESDKGWTLLYHYHPPCPKPELALGTVEHTDVSVITILLQDEIGGFQILHDKQWVNVEPIPGALLVNIGDTLQMASNDKFKSVIHRAKAQNIGSRISIAFFFSGLLHNGKKYGPIKELISDENPPIYKDFTIEDLLTHFFSKSFKDLRIDNFKLSSSN